MSIKEITIHTSNQGSILINHGFEYCRDDRMVLVEIDLKAKYAYVSATSETFEGHPEIFLEADENTIHLFEEFTTPEVTTTVIALTDYTDYDIFCHDISKYTLRIALVKKSVIEEL